MGLFSKKPGGTFFGNLLRVGGQAVSKAAGVPGLLGSGANKIEVGQTVTNAQLSMSSVATPSIAAPNTVSVPSLGSIFGGTSTSTTTAPGGNNNILLLIGAAVAALFLLKKR